ncbi:MAG: putative lipid II flippase FtsW [Clostridiales bacterium]|nr:putative lipid II flippase FtsW [Clostridiales bacterium]
MFKLNKLIKRRLNSNDLLAVGNMDMPFFCLVMLLLTIGLIMVFSASYVVSRFDYNNAYEVIKNQLMYACVGIVGMLVVSRINYKTIKFFDYAVLALSFILLVYSLVKPAKVNISGASNESFKRWIEIFGIRFQPSEIAKFALILFCAAEMSNHHKAIDRDWKMMLPYIIVICIMSVLILKENHISGAILVFLIGVIMMYLGGMRRSWVIVGLTAVGVGLIIFLLEPDKTIEVITKIIPKAGVRLSAWHDKNASARGVRWQINQSLYAIGSGGLFGLGLGNSKQKHLFLPESNNDFIFSVVCEELGFIGAVVILILFALLIWRGFVIAMNTGSRFSAMLVMGIMAQVGLQTLLHVAVVTDTVPNTGIGLPFFSSGGTSLILLLLEMGAVLSVSRYSKITKK